MNLNGTIMSCDIETAKVENGKVIPIKENLMPLYIKRTGDIEGWLSQRAIDSHRTNSRLLKKALRLSAAEDIEIVLKVHAATITDNYWFKEAGSSLTYKDIKFKENMFDKLALYGDPDSFNNSESHTPELTNIGSYEKCWRLNDGNWWIYKQGNDNEQFSELFIYYLGKALGFSMAHYEKDDGYIKSLDFTKQAQQNFEPMSSIVGDDEDYIKNFNILYDISPDIAKDYVNMIYLDTICFNMDRHTKNYGVLRDTKSGDIVALAPNFDNNITLISRGYPKNIARTNDKLIELFAELICANGAAKHFYEEIPSENVSEDLICECISKTGFDVDADKICAFILNGADMTETVIHEQA